MISEARNALSDLPEDFSNTMLSQAPDPILPTPMPEDEALPSNRIR